MVGSIYILCRWLKFLLEAKLKLAIWKLYIESIRNSLCSQVHCTSQPKQQQSGLSLKVGSSPGHCELDPCQLSWETDHRTSQPKQQQSGLSLKAGSPPGYYELDACLLSWEKERTKRTFKMFKFICKKCNFQ